MAQALDARKSGRQGVLRASCFTVKKIDAVYIHSLYNDNL